MAPPSVPEPEDISFWQEVFRWLTISSQGWERFGKLALLCLLGLVALLWAIGYVTEKLAQLLEVYKNSGLPVTLDRQSRHQIRRRRQFCSVINADLAVLAKAENWNDQYFTDLEAEVEAEGGYYPSALHRLFRRKSRGLRRASSLIEAIESSTEPALLLVGEPGSGKSVALRHLAHQLAQRGMRSRDPEAKIPLYVNLKELSVSSEKPSADSIKAFILDNIRRGDADTAAYVRDNWEDFKFRGRWFFLFDSFDEIPLVLHAPTGSSVIRDYSEAIRQFLDGLGSCRGVLASREFKGPDALPWQKLRILPLSELRQDRLIDNSFLEQKQKDVVRRHLVASGSSLGNNPMFLTLLCRYVREGGHAPTNDHDLLSGHLERLAVRDSDYIQRKYSLSSKDLTKGAEQLAVLFATTPDFGLAPSLFDISLHVKDLDLPTDALENLLAALVDVKILRSDVQEAKPGDRRFTFSHRRYQETLFARFLAGNPTFLSPRALLTDSRWREYTVALLQTQDELIIRPLLTEACHLLELCSANQPRREIIQQLGGDLGYFAWEADSSADLLGLLQEGLARRLRLVTPQLASQIGRLLQTRWEQGDVYDRTMVIKLGGLLPQVLLKEYLLNAINSASQQMRSIAFRQSTFMTEMPKDLAEWVRRRLSHALLVAIGRGEIQKLEALSARLPASLGSSFVLRRCLLLRHLLLPLNVIMLPAQAIAMLILAALNKQRLNQRSGIRVLSRSRERLLSPPSVWLFMVGFPGALLLSLIVEHKVGELWSRGSFGLVLWMGFGLVLIPLYVFRSAGQRVNGELLLRSLKVKRIWKPLTWAILCACFPVVIVKLLQRFEAATFDRDDALFGLDALCTRADAL